MVTFDGSPWLQGGEATVTFPSHAPFAASSAAGVEPAGAHRQLVEPCWLETAFAYP